MEPIIERITASFVPDGQHFFRVISAEQFAAGIEHADAERLRRCGYMIDPFIVSGRFGSRTVYRISADPIPEADEVVMATDLEGDDNPFDVIELVERQRVEDELIPWSLDDQAKAASFTARRRVDLNASLDASDRWLAIRSPFAATVNR